MNTYGAKQLANSFRTVRKNTLQIAEDIPESSYNFVPAEGTRTVARSLAHIAVTTRLWQDFHAKNLTNAEDYDWMTVFTVIEEEEKRQRSKAELIDFLRKEGESFASFLESLSDEALSQEINQGDGAKKTRLEDLMSAKEHEMHCRGQLMLIERMLGIVPHLTKKYEQMEKEYKEKMQAKGTKEPQPA